MDRATCCAFAGPAGTFAASTFSVSCTLCPEGYISPSGSTSMHDCTPIIEGRCLGNTDAGTDVTCPAEAVPIATAAITRSSSEDICCEMCGETLKPDVPDMDLVELSGAL